MSSIGLAQASEIRGACALQYALGVISPNINITIVIIPVAIPTPADPNLVIANSVLIAAAAMLTKLLLNMTVVNMWFGSSRSLFNALDPFLFSSKNCLTCASVTEKNATSIPPKKADKLIRIAIIVIPKVRSKSSYCTYKYLINNLTFYCSNQR